MSASFRFEELDSFVPGAVGPPGERVFYLQATSGQQVVSFRLEKEQVGMLGRYLGQLAAALGDSEPDDEPRELVEPVVPEWVVGSLAVGVDEEARLIHVTAEEMVPEDRSFGELTEEDVDELLESEPGGAEAHFTLEPRQAAAFARAAAELVAAGRPPCRLCGRPMEPEGHACPRWN